MATTHGWAEVDEARKREILDAIASGGATAGPAHAELDLTDRCNVACYFCNQQDVRTSEQLPLERVRELVDELVEGGLRSVRLAGGGDPLAYRGIEQVLDRLEEREVVVDNVTTNGALLGPEIARRLAAPGRCREVLFSLNAVDAADYHRMMQVKPETFDRVLANVRGLVAARDGRAQPRVVVQFLVDRDNYRRLAEMYELGVALGADRIALGSVLEIPLERVGKDRILGADDFELVRPFVESVLKKDRAAKRLFLLFAYQEWNRELEVVRSRLALAPELVYPTAPSFREKDGGCFFAWYSATVRGNGDLYPCCMLLNPTYRPLGNVLRDRRSFREHWLGAAFSRLRAEMREVLLAGGELRFSRRRFRHLEPQCVTPFACGLKNMYFRGDEAFYRELGERLDERRRREIGLFAGRRGAWRWVAIRSFRLRRRLVGWVKPAARRFGAPLASLGRRLERLGRRLAGA